MPGLLLQGLLGSSLVAVGGFVIGTTPPGDWVSRIDPLADARTSGEAGYVLVFVGLGVLTWAWVRLGGLVRGRPDGVRRVGIAAALWALPLLPVPPLFSDDGWSYAAEGVLTGQHLSPYDVPPSALNGPIVQAVNPAWVDTTAPYGPLPMLWGGAASQVSQNPWLMLYAYRALALVGLCLLAYAVPRLAVIGGRDPATAAWLAIASPLVLAHGIAGLHLDLVLAGLMACALLLAATRGWVVTSLVAGAALAVKMSGLAVVVGVVLLSLRHGSLLVRLRRTAGVTALTAATAVSLGLVGGLGVGWVGAVHVPWTHPSWLSVTRYVGLVGGGVPALTVAAVGGVVLLGVVSLVVLLRTPLADRAVAVAAAAVILGLSTALAPVVHYWYVLGCLPILACARLGRVPERAVVGLIAALGILAPADPSQHFPYVMQIVLAVLGATLVAAALPSNALSALSAFRDSGWLLGHLTPIGDRAARASERRRGRRT